LLNDLPPCPLPALKTHDLGKVTLAASCKLDAPALHSKDVDELCYVHESENSEPRVTSAKAQQSFNENVQAVMRIRSRSKTSTLVWEFLEEPELVPGGILYASAMTGATILSALLTLIQTLEQTPVIGMFPAMLEVLFDTLFSIEIFVRGLASPSKTAFFSQGYNLLDIAAGIITLGMRLAAGLRRPENWQTSAQWTILFCFVPILRLLKLTRRFEKLHLLSQAFRHALEALPVLLYTLCILVLTGALVIYLVEPNSNIPSYPDAIWFTIVTITTVGYGDVVPQTNLGKLVVSILTIMSALYMAMPLGIVGSAFSTVWNDRDRLVLMHRTQAQLRRAGYRAKDIVFLFRLFDANHDGQLDYREFRCLIHEMHVGISETRIAQLFCTFDTDDSGFVDQEEFVKILCPTTFTQNFLTRMSMSDSPMQSE